SVVISSRLRYQLLRGLMRNVSLALAVNRSQVHLTSLAVKGFPSCHRTPSRNAKVSSVPSSFHDQLVASSGTIVSGRFCFTCWSYRTRLLKTPIIGRVATTVASSWIDIEAGLSIMYSRRMPPDFCARALGGTQAAAAKPADNASARQCCCIAFLPFAAADLPLRRRAAWPFGALQQARLTRD